MRWNLALLLAAAALGASGMPVRAQAPIASALGLVSAVPAPGSAQDCCGDTACGAAACSGSACGMDCCQSCSPCECECPLWDGFYFGGHAGWGWSRPSATAFTLPVSEISAFGSLSPTTLHPDGSGFLGGVHAGYNKQFGFLVAGLETDFTWTGMSGSQSIPVPVNGLGPIPGSELAAHQSIDWFGTVRGRVGVALDRVLVYATGGFAYGNVVSSNTVEFPHLAYPASISTTQVGWTVGGGVEYAISRHWSWKLEYLYFDLGKQTAIANPVPPNPPFQTQYDWETRGHTFNTGLNYRF